MAKLDADTLRSRFQWVQQDYRMDVQSATPMDKYPAKQHAERVAQKLGVDQGLIYLPGASLRLEADSDMARPFRQLRYFYYLSGCNEHDCHLTYDLNHNILTLFIPKINPARVIWNGRGSTPAEAYDKYDVDEVRYTDSLQLFMEKWSALNKGKLYLLHPTSATSTRFLRCFSDSDVDTESLQPAMGVARMVKDEHEINLIKKANDISSKAHREVLSKIAGFKNEAQVEGLFLDFCISNGAKSQAYAPIAASGTNAGTLHYDNNDEPLEGRQLMCLDAGCSWDCYASDITRTFPLKDSWPSEEAREIYYLVQEMQEQCIERLGPGVRYLDLHILAHYIAIKGLLKLGIFHNGTVEDIFKAGTSKAFFPHGLGHHVGLEVHDIGQGDLMSLALAKDGYQGETQFMYPIDHHLPVYDPQICLAPVDTISKGLEEGMVVTVEPGIYFSAFALKMFYFPSPVHSRYINKDVLLRYMPVGGVRIEDDILITSKGHENLTKAPKGEEMLKIIRGDESRVLGFSHENRRPQMSCGPTASTAKHEDREASATPKLDLSPQSRWTAIWDPRSKFRLADKATRYLGSMPGKANKTLTHDQVSMMLDSAPSLIELCEMLEDRGVQVDTTAFIREILRAKAALAAPVALAARQIVLSRLNATDPEDAWRTLPMPEWVIKKEQRQVDLKREAYVEIERRILGELDWHEGPTLFSNFAKPVDSVDNFADRLPVEKDEAKNEANEALPATTQPKGRVSSLFRWVREEREKSTELEKERDELRQQLLSVQAELVDARDSLRVEKGEAVAEANKSFEERRQRMLTQFKERSGIISGQIRQVRDRNEEITKERDEFGQRLLAVQNELDEARNALRETSLNSVFGGSRYDRTANFETAHDRVSSNRWTRIENFPRILDFRTLAAKCINPEDLPSYLEELRLRFAGLIHLSQNTQSPEVRHRVAYALPIIGGQIQQKLSSMLLEHGGQLRERLRGWFGRLAEDLAGARAETSTGKKVVEELRIAVEQARGREVVGRK